MPSAGLRPGSGARLKGRVLNPGSRIDCRFGGPVTGQVVGPDQGEGPG